MKDALLILLLAACSAFAVTPPNIILVVTDDQGYGDLSCHGNPVVRTPNLDRLHDESVRFTDFHVAPMCTPTRGQLMTGVDCLRNGAMNVSSGRTLLRREFPTLPELLKPAGYRTALFGKWHLGDNYPFRPQDRGFDECVWYPSSHIGSLPDAWGNDYFDDTYQHRDQREKYQGYTTDAFFREAMRWMKTQRGTGKPFFVYLPTAAPHTPLYVPKRYRDAVQPRLEAALSKLPKLSPAVQEDLVRFLAMIENIDENMGRLDKFLDDEQLKTNTILVFLTDNGSTMGAKYFNAGMTGGKMTLWEGGHRVPLFIRWPGGRFGSARDEKNLTEVQDILPTLLELCGVSVPAKVDGMSLARLLRGADKGLPDRMLVINYSQMPFIGKERQVEPQKGGAAVLWKNWRLLNNKRLYDVAADPLQQHDIAASNPDVVKKMQAHLETWWQGVKDRVNEPQRIIIGSDAENPTLLSACEWWNVFVDQQAQVRRGELKNSVWHLDVAKAGDYEIELRRWPREINLPLAASAPALALADGELPPGIALPIAKAQLKVGAQEQSLDLKPDSTHATFRFHLQPGPVRLESTFLNAEGKSMLGAYYVYVKRL